MMQRASVPQGLRTAFGLGAVLLTQLAWVRSSNFGGYDEWLILELNRRGVLSVPYAYRPLALIWTAPPAWLAGQLGFFAYTLAFAAYALLSSALVFWLVRRLVPERPLLALLSACFLLVWAPADLARLSTVERAAYQGITLGVLLASALLVEALLRKSVALLALSALMAFVAVRCYEGSLALLLGAPALLLLTQPRSRRLWLWVAAWEGVVVLGLASFLLEMLPSPWQHTYHAVALRPDPRPIAWLFRMLWQYAYHLSPLVGSDWRELLTPAVPVAAAVFVLALVLLGQNPGPDSSERRPLLAAGALGLGLAGLGYSVVLLGVTTSTAFRLQFLSGPGMALCLAAAVQLGASLLPGRTRFAAAAVLGAWVVALGTGRTVALQRVCDEQTYHPRQVRMLSGLLRVVPNLAPHTLIILLEEGRAWPATIGFHHAVQYLYERRAAGWLPGRWDVPYPAAFGPDGVRVEPWPIVRRAWDAPKTLYRYDELVAVRHTRAGEVALLESWPRELAPLPPGAAYAPKARLRPGSLARAAILS